MHKTISPGASVSFLENPIVGFLLDLLTFILTGGLVMVLRKIFGHDKILSDHQTALALCAQRDDQRDLQRIEDRKLRDAQRNEMREMITTQHATVIDSISALSSKIDTID